MENIEMSIISRSSEHVRTSEQHIPREVPICLFTRGKIGKLLSPRTWQATKRRRRHLDTLFVHLNGNDRNYDLLYVILCV